MNRYYFINILLLFLIRQQLNAQEFYKFYSLEEAKKNYNQLIYNKNYTTALYWADYIQTVETSKEKLDTSSIAALVDEIGLYQQLGLYENTKEYAEKLYSIGTKLDNPKKYNPILIGKGIIYGNGQMIKHHLYLSEVRKAEKYAEQLAKRLPNIKASSSDLTSAFLNLSSFYITTGLFHKADSLLYKCYPEVSLHQSSIEDNSNKIEAIRIYGDLYAALKNRKKAKTFYLMAYKGYEERYGFHAEMVQILIKLGEISTQEKLYKDADAYFLQALDLLSKKVGKVHRLYANALSLMAQSQDYAKKVNRNITYKYHIECLKIFKILKKESDLDYALAFQRWLYHNLFINPQAKLNFESNPTQIEREIGLSLRIIEKELKKESIESILALSQSAIWYFQNGSPEKGKGELMQSNARLTKKIYEQTTFLTEAEQIDMIDFLEDRFAFTYSYIVNYTHLFPELSGSIFDNFMILKGLLVNSKNVILKGLQQNTQSAKANIKIKELRENQEKLSKLLTKEKNPSTKRIDELNLLIENDQKELKKLVPGYELLKKTYKINWKTVRDSIPSSAVLIDFIHFRYFDVQTKQNTEKIVYYALVLKKEYPFPKIIRLFEEPELEMILNQKNITTDEYIALLYEGKRGIGKTTSNLNKPTSIPSKPLPNSSKKPSSNTKKTTPSTNKPAVNKPSKPNDVVEQVNPPINLAKDALFNLIWAKVDSSCQGKAIVYISPTGLLNKIAFSSISQNQQLLIDRFQLVQLSNSRGVLEKGNSILSSEEKIALYGGINYNLYPNNSHKTVPLPRSIPQKDNQKTYWKNLSGTELEVDQIKSIFLNSTLFKNENASEESFKSLSGKSNKVIHLATHGFFADSSFVAKNIVSEDQRTLAFFSSTDPLIRSGLLLAGANLAWGNNRPPLDQEDGILTAYELANLDLSNTKLAVLSACETGLGDINNTEGVFGLQRALKMAGVEQYIISLWEVPDKETQELMTLFYKKLAEGTDIQDAFTYAQREMRKKYSPYYWAAFVLVR